MISRPGFYQSRCIIIIYFSNETLKSKVNVAYTDISQSYYTYKYILYIINFRQRVCLFITINYLLDLHELIKLRTSPPIITINYLLIGVMICFLHVTEDIL